MIESISVYVQVLHWCIKTKQKCGQDPSSPPSTTPRYVMYSTVYMYNIYDDVPPASFLVYGEDGRAPASICPGFDAHMKGMVQVWLDRIKATKKEKDASTPKSKPKRGGGLGRRNGGRGGTIWSPVVGVGTQMARQVNGLVWAPVFYCLVSFHQYFIIFVVQSNKIIT